MASSSSTHLATQNPTNLKNRPQVWVGPDYTQPLVDHLKWSDQNPTKKDIWVINQIRYHVRFQEGNQGLLNITSQNVLDKRGREYQWAVMPAKYVTILPFFCWITAFFSEVAMALSAVKYTRYT
jgi:hypothetical protein